MITTKKQEFLLKNGRKQKTIDFCKDLKVESKHFVWICEKIEKEQFSIENEEFKKSFEKILILLNKTNRYNNIKSITKLIPLAERYVESKESVKSRILHKFKNGHFIINLSAKELFFEGLNMSNCINDLSGEVLDKKVGILALKDKEDKTLAHIQINKLGFLEQHYSKANTYISLENWKYIEEFFNLYKDESFFEIVNSTNIDVNYDISHRGYNFLPVIDYFIPTKFSSSISDLNKTSVDKKFYIKNFVNNERINSKTQSLNKEGVFEYLSEFRNYINKSIDNMMDIIDITDKNYLVLKDEIIYKIFNSKPKNVEEKISFVDVDEEHCKKEVFDNGNFEMEQEMDEIGDFDVETDINPLEEKVREQDTVNEQEDKIMLSNLEDMDKEPILEEYIEDSEFMEKNIEVDLSRKIK